MDTYSMTQVETLTGINAHTLRIWERRYDILKAHRSETNIRYYTDDQLKKLLNISILTKNGFRISKINNMQDAEIQNNVIKILNTSNDTNSEEIYALTAAMVDYDEESFNLIYQRSILRKGVLHTVTHLIYPFLNHVGVLWGTNKAIPSQEHFMSNLIRQKILSAIDMVQLPLKSNPSALLFLMEGEDHELGLLLSQFIIKDFGWNCIYLGQRTPIENIQDVLLKTNAKLLLTMLTIPRNQHFTAYFIKTIKQYNMPLLFAGNPSFAEDFKNEPIFNYLENPQQLIDYLSNTTT